MTNRTKKVNVGRNNGKMGQPTKYKKIYCAQMLDFFQNKPRQVVEEEEYIRDDEVKVRKVMKKRGPPTITEFATIVGIRRATLYEWCKQHPEFDEVFALCKDIQEHKLVEGTLVGDYIGSFPMLFLKNNHGWADKVESKVTGKLQLEDIVGGSMDDEDDE